MDPLDEPLKVKRWPIDFDAQHLPLLPSLVIERGAGGFDYWLSWLGFSIDGWIDAPGSICRIYGAIHRRWERFGHSLIRKYVLRDATNKENEIFNATFDSKHSAIRAQFNNEYPNQWNPIGLNVVVDHNPEHDWKYTIDYLRKSGDGQVINYSNSNGLYFEVKLKNGQSAWYEMDEIKSRSDI